MPKTLSSRSFNSVPPDRRIYLMGEVDQAMHHSLSEQLAERESCAPILIVLDSEGGEVYCALGMYDAIRMFPGHVYILVRGRAMSSAAVVLQAADTRLITAHSSIMLHRLSYSIEDTLDAHGHQHKVSQDLQAMLDEVLLNRCTLSPADLKKRTRSDYYLRGAEALELGLVDEIVE